MSRKHEYPNIATPEFHEVETTDLYRALTHPKLLKGVRAIARHTRKTGIEGGLAVYMNQGRLTVSEPVLPSEEELRKHTAYHHALEAFKEGYEGFNSSQLTLHPLEGRITDEELASQDEDIQNVIYNRVKRNDVLLMVHSHPLEAITHTYAVEEMLCPSMDDMDGFERVEQASPGHVEGIVVSTSKDSSLLLYGISPTRDYHQYYKRIERVTNPSKFLETLHQSGFNLATLKVTNGPEFAQQAAQAVAILNS